MSGFWASWPSSSQVSRERDGWTQRRPRFSGPPAIESSWHSLKELAEKIRRVGLIGNSEKVSCAGVVQQAARLVRATGRKLFSDPVTAQWAGIKAHICQDAAGLARRVDLLLVFGGDGTML